MREILSNGADYLIVPLGVRTPVYPDVLAISETVSAARRLCEEDWSRFWHNCGIAPARSISILEY
jgi:hypothetical protein